MGLPIFCDYSDSKPSRKSATDAKSDPTVHARSSIRRRPSIHRGTFPRPPQRWSASHSAGHWSPVPPGPRSGYWSPPPPPPRSPPPALPPAPDPAEATAGSSRPMRDIRRRQHNMQQREQEQLQLLDLQRLRRLRDAHEEPQRSNGDLLSETMRSILPTPPLEISQQAAGPDTVATLAVPDITIQHATGLGDRVRSPSPIDRPSPWSFIPSDNDTRPPPEMAPLERLANLSERLTPSRDQDFECFSDTDTDSLSSGELASGGPRLLLTAHGDDAAAASGTNPNDDQSTRSNAPERTPYRFDSSVRARSRHAARQTQQYFGWITSGDQPDSRFTSFAPPPYHPPPASGQRSDRNAEAPLDQGISRGVYHANISRGDTNFGYRPPHPAPQGLATTAARRTNPSVGLPRRDPAEADDDDDYDDDDDAPSQLSQGRATTRTERSDPSTGLRPSDSAQFARRAAARIRDARARANDDARERHSSTPPMPPGWGGMFELNLDLDSDLEQMRGILERLSRRQDIPDEWWMSAGLSRDVVRPAGAGETSRRVERLLGESRL